jgi:hypothetical protein
MIILPNAAEQTVPLTGISSGAINENQHLTIAAISSDPTLISQPAISYTSPSTTGVLRFTPLLHATGSALITVTVQDDGGTANGGQDSVTRTFQVTVGLALQISRFGVTNLLSFATAIGPNYTVEYKTSLDAPVWTLLNTVPGTGASVTLIDAAPPDSSRFYRLRGQ